MLGENLQIKLANVFKILHFEKKLILKYLFFHKVLFMVLLFRNNIFDQKSPIHTVMFQNPGGSPDRDTGLTDEGQGHYCI